MVHIGNFHHFSNTTKINMTMYWGYFLFVIWNIILCSARKIPKIPGDNSHYVEGKTRYLWFPDGNNVPRLADLQPTIQPKIAQTDDQIQYWLFTKQNPKNHTILKINDKESVKNSNYDPANPLIVVIHGYYNDGDSLVNILIRNAFLELGDYNIVVVDWSKSQSYWYPSSVSVIPEVGKNVGKFMEWLIEGFGGDWEKVHMIGHSLGAHVAGNAGRTLGGRAARITGMDPAGPLVKGKELSLTSTDAQYVECINTDGNTLGIYDPICKANFYPNGGVNPQPGCSYSTCSHSISYEYVAASILHNKFVAVGCTDLEEMSKNQCQGDKQRMGNAAFHKNPEYSIYTLTTEPKYPYYKKIK